VSDFIGIICVLLIWWS